MNETSLTTMVLERASQYGSKRVFTHKPSGKVARYLLARPLRTYCPEQLTAWLGSASRPVTGLPF